MKIIKILAILSLLLGITFISIGSLYKTFYYENDSEVIIVKSFIILISILAMISGILVIIFSILFFIKRKKISIFFLLALIGMFIGSFLFISSNKGGKSLDAIRESDLRQISLAMELYRDREEEGQYLEIKTVNGYVENMSIGSFLASTPKNIIKEERILNWKFIKSLPYRGFSNSHDKNKYCIYAEIWGEKILAVSHKGTKMLNKAPINLDCW